MKRYLGIILAMFTIAAVLTVGPSIVDQDTATPASAQVPCGGFGPIEIGNQFGCVTVYPWYIGGGVWGYYSNATNFDSDNDVEIWVRSVAAGSPWVPAYTASGGSWWDSSAVHSGQGFGYDRVMMLVRTWPGGQVFTFQAPIY